MATLEQTPTRTRIRDRRPGVDAAHPHYKWWALSCTSLGMLVATINSGTLIIALPDLERALHTSLLQLVWVILVYMIASTVLVLTAGRLSDLFGRKRAYVAGFVDLRRGLAGRRLLHTGTELILWRVLQGIGGAFLFANAAAIVTDAFPREQLGLAMGTNTMIAAVGLVIGPVLGGALVSIDWPWVFWFNVPLGIAGSVWAALNLRELGRTDKDRTLDIGGTVTYVIGLTALVYAISRGGLSGWNDGLVIGGFAIAAVLLPAFLLIERRHRAPMLDLVDLPRQAVRRRERRRVHQRPVALRAAVHLRLLLPGRAGRRPDHRGHQARTDGARDARGEPPRGHLGGPPRLAHAGGARNGRDRRRARRHDRPPAAYGVLGERPVARRSWASARACSTARTRPR